MKIINGHKVWLDEDNPATGAPDTFCIELSDGHFLVINPIFFNEEDTYHGLDCFFMKEGEVIPINQVW